MSRKIVCIPVLVTLFILPPLLLAEDTITLTTYYPSPHGVYREMRAKRVAIGDNYIDHANYTWEETDGDGGEVDYNADLIVEGNVGIGTTTPGAKLDILSLTGGNLLQMGAGASGTWRVRYDNYNLVLENDYQAAPSFNSRATIRYDGKVGIGTTSPGYKLQVVGSSTGGDGMVFGNTYHNYGFWNPAADLHTLNIGVIDNSVWTGINIWNNGAARMRINPDGNVGIGSASPSYTLHVAGTAYCTSGSWSGSDLRWKKDIRSLNNPLPKLSRLRGVEFNWKQDEFKENHFPAGRQIGLIAQELEREFPELVTTDNAGYKAVAYDRLTAVLLEAIKAQQKQIDDLKQQVKDLKRP